jgi:hypothetical protein
LYIEIGTGVLHRKTALCSKPSGFTVLPYI